MRYKTIMKNRKELYAEKERIESLKMQGVLEKLQDCPKDELYSRVCFIAKHYYNRYKDKLEYKPLKDI